jgi:transposase
MKEEQNLDDVAEFYNERASVDPSNAPSRRDIAEEFGVSSSTAQTWLRELVAAGKLCFPVRRRPGRLRGGRRG